MVEVAECPEGQEYCPMCGICTDPYHARQGRELLNIIEEVKAHALIVDPPDYDPREDQQ